MNQNFTTCLAALLLSGWLVCPALADDSVSEKNAPPSAAESAIDTEPFVESQSESNPEPEVSGMTVDHMEAVVARLDEKYERAQGVISFVYADQEVVIVTDSSYDRMRIIIPIMQASVLNEDMLFRIMQANFDSALDARYAIGQGVLWSTFIHRLSSLTEKDFLSGIGQTINTAQSFGSSFSSGEIVYGGGDSSDIQQRQLIEQLQREGSAI